MGSTIFDNIPKFDGSFAGSDGNLWSILIPIKTGYRIWAKLTEFDDSIIISIPKIEAAI